MGIVGKQEQDGELSSDLIKIEIKANRLWKSWLYAHPVAHNAFMRCNLHLRLSALMLSYKICSLIHNGVKSSGLPSPFLHVIGCTLQHVSRAQTIRFYLMQIRIRYCKSCRFLCTIYA